MFAVSPTRNNYLFLQNNTMKITQLEKLQAFIKENEKQYDFNDYVWNYIEEEELVECQDSVDVRDYLERINEDRELTDKEVIYYAKAMEYLRKEDPSLQISVWLAHDMWFTIDQVNSEMLASLLMTDDVNEQWCEFINEVEEFCDELFE